MPDDSFYTGDPDFMAGHPSDQMRYIAANDKDFAVANPIDQFRYLAHLTGTGPVGSVPAPPMTKDAVGLQNPNAMQHSGLFTALNNTPSNADPHNAGNITPQAMQQMDPQTQASTRMQQLMGAGIGVSSGAPVVNSVKGAIAGIPSIAAMAAIQYAQQNLPLGKYIPKGAEYLPMFMHGKPGEGPPPATRAEGQMAEDLPIPAGKVPQPGPRPNGPYSGPNTPAFMEPAQSGTIAKHGYIPESQTMVTEFKNGKVYDARGVPKEVYDNFRNAESQGSFYAQNIKGRYNSRYRGSVSPTSSK